jgi:hypothetical protein
MKLTASRMKQAEFVRTIWSATPEHGTPFEALLEPGYWAHVAAFLKPNDRIEVLAEDGSYFAELIVRSTQRVSVVVTLLRKVDLESAAAEQEDAEFAVKFRGAAKWSIVRTKDNAVVKEHIPTRKDAERDLGDYLKALAA